MVEGKTIKTVNQIKYLGTIIRNNASTDLATAPQSTMPDKLSVQLNLCYTKRK